MNLAVDIGNSLVKMAVIDDGQIVDVFRSANPDRKFMDAVFTAYPQLEGAISVSSRGDIPEAEEYFRGKIKKYIKFGPDVAVPISNCYATPETLGQDRLAAAVGANALYPNSNILIVDFGTAITIDVVSQRNEFLGGNISPGMTTRFRALHEFTGKLPLGQPNETTELYAQSSIKAIESGVINGIVYEIEGYIADLESQFDDLRIIFTGGDGNFFAKRVKRTIFATHDLVVYGLNRILEYNAD